MFELATFLMLQVFVGILRCYTAIFAVLVILAETEWERLFRFWRVSHFKFIRSGYVCRCELYDSAQLIGSVMIKFMFAFLNSFCESRDINKR